MAKKALLFLLILAFAVRLTPVKADEDFFPSATSTVSYTDTTTPALPIVTSTVDAVTTTIDDSAPSSTPENLIDEPHVRVGIAKTDKKVTFVSPFSYTLTDGAGNDLGLLPENEVATLSYAYGVYRFESQSLSATSSQKLRLVPDDLNNYFSIMSLDRHLVSRSQLNFNAFRGIFEYWYSAKSQMPYLINESLLDNYVAGVGETSNSAPAEYIKALQIAARTYAYINIIGPPSTKNMFDVYASTVDQLYLGYNFESFSPRIAFYSGGTRGLMVTYKDKPVVTYYFSQSSGHTKTRKGTPWLRSVSAKYDKGRRMLGHGYGMSNHDAILRASKDGWSYDKILNYYYSGTKVEKIY